MTHIRLLLIDVSSLMYRAHYTLDPERFKRPSDSKANNVVYGVATMTLSLIKQFSKNTTLHIVACMDSKTCNVSRKQVSQDYKSTRPQCPPTMAHQFEWVKQLLESLHIVYVDKTNYEADDVIASYCSTYYSKYDDIIIASPDKDLCQLVNDKVCIYNTHSKKILHEEDVYEKHGVGPKDFVLYQAFMGDKIDNVSGVPGIGPKTAADIIAQCKGDLDYYVNECKTHKKHKKIVDQLDTIKRNMQLVQLCKNLDVPEVSEIYSLKLMKSAGDFRKFLDFVEINASVLRKQS